MTTVATMPTRSGYFAEPRHRSAIALLVGAAAMLGLIQTGAVRFYYTPIVVGLAYLAAAAVAGRRGALWAPGIITSLWGIAVLLGVHNVTHGSKASYELAGAIGIALSLVLRYTIGLAAGFVGMVVAFGAILLHDNGHAPSWVFKGVTFGALLAVWGLWELRPARRAVDRSSVSTEMPVDLRDKPATASA
jgi:hypothetical protein